MRQLLIRNGTVELSEVPAPSAEPGLVLVATSYSCISPGTETAALGTVTGRLRRDPKARSQAWRIFRRVGFSSFVDIAQGKLSQSRPIGYSIAGIVVDAGGHETLSPGMPVACTGGGWACHAEVTLVPHNLCVPVPEGVRLTDASTVALGAIALQGIRRAEVELGSIVFVVGLGVLGQLTCRLAAAAGCRVVAVDLDPQRVAVATTGGADLASVDAESALAHLDQLSGGAGADVAILTAASKSDELLSLACRAVRRKGRVVVVGDVGLGLRREDAYAKELDIVMSTSYGPGRYDPSYEEGGLDYPYGYVRWTERRNMEAYLAELARGRVRLDELAPVIMPLAEAPQWYADFATRSARPLVPLIEYPRAADGVPTTVIRFEPRRLAQAKAGRVRLGLIGAGSFAQGVHLPNLRRLSDRFDVRAVCTRTGASAASAASRAGAQLATTDVAALLEEPDVDAVLISTRHDTHAALVLRALRAGKHVFVEKPLCLTEAELEAIAQLRQKSGSTRPVLQVGFNRRFSPYLRRVRDLVANAGGPCLVRYRMNAAPSAPGHWTTTAQGGGRNLGEACHVYDVFTYLIGSATRDVRAVSLGGHGAASRDNFSATVSFEDGSIATLMYTTVGHFGVAKEHLEVFVGGRSAVLNDFADMQIHERARRQNVSFRGKGHLEELRAFADAIQGTAPQEPSDEAAVQAMRIAFAVEAQL